MNKGRPSDILLFPAGVFEMAPEQTASLRRLEATVLETFGLWGYQEVRTPALEYVDTMSRALEADELDMAFKLVDRDTGKMMVLRSDVTPQVARMASHALSGIPLPLRLCYVSDVYRHAGDPSHPKREMIQAGVELLGLQDPQADAEVLALGVRALAATGMAGIRMSVGQVQYAQGLFSQAGLDRATEDRLVRAACRKDQREIAKILGEGGVVPEVWGGILLLGELDGSMEMLHRAHTAASNDTSRNAITHLRHVLDMALSYGVAPEQLTVDLGELTAFRYHTGPVFTGYISGAGRAVLKGGRYDNLTGRYGRQIPATGFAIDILEILELSAAREEANSAIDYVLVNRTGDRDKGLEISMDLRSRNRKVLCLIRDIPDEDLGTFVRDHRIGRVIILQSGGLYSFDTRTGQKVPCRTEDL